MAAQNTQHQKNKLFIIIIVHLTHSYATMFTTSDPTQVPFRHGHTQQTALAVILSSYRARTYK